MSISDLYPIIMEYALESASASNYEELQSTEGWLADCLKDAEMQFDDLYASKDHSKLMTYIYLYKVILWLCYFRNFSGADDVHIDVAGMRYCFLYSVVLTIFFSSFFILSFVQCISYLKTYATVELCNFTPEYEQNVVQHHQLTPTPRNIVFKGLTIVFLILSFFSLDIEQNGDNPWKHTTSPK